MMTFVEIKVEVAAMAMQTPVADQHNSEKVSISVLVSPWQSPVTI